MSSRDSPKSCFNCRSRLRISAWIVTSSAVVGSSATISDGRQQSASADQGTLAESTRTTGGVLAETARRVVHPHRGEQVDGGGLRVGAAEPMHRHRLDELTADGEDRIERAHRLLEDQRDLGAARTRSISASGRSMKLRPSMWISPSRMRPGGGAGLSSEYAVRDLPLPDSPTSARVSPLSMSNSRPGRRAPSGYRWESRSRWRTESRGIGGFRASYHRPREGYLALPEACPIQSAQIPFNHLQTPPLMNSSWRSTAPMLPADRVCLVELHAGVQPVCRKGDRCGRHRESTGEGTGRCHGRRRGL